ncbi:CCAAT/enhancer-binding protein gamma [Diabrotica virgifera virgifera]|uniref:CCAAT/enhancer-binding protein gamma-like n=1 Tax=Diabrotica virgifera virgifera TaxID=50390 RepID=A0A6P7G0D2_DIAVI|nr:CCAAT/enhancer-binding protein gamma [Diabrotica virgifera virgifera]
MTKTKMPRKAKPKKDGPESGEDSDEYRKRRDRNNLAVKRSRVKSKQKTQETLSRVTELRNENTVLEEKVKTLTKELGFLKELFLAHASNSADKNKFEGVDLNKLLQDPADESTSSGNNT